MADPGDRAEGRDGDRGSWWKVQMSLLVAGGTERLGSEGAEAEVTKNAVGGDEQVKGEVRRLWGQALMPPTQPGQNAQ